RGAPARPPAGRGRRRVRARRRRLALPLRRLLATAGRRARARDGGQRLVVIPAAVRAALEEHAREEAPNEACGLIILRDGEAVPSGRGRTPRGSPSRFGLDIAPELWFLEDEGYELAVFHSHPASPAKPSRTDMERIGLWAGRPFLILSLSTGELNAFRIDGN